MLGNTLNSLGLPSSHMIRKTFHQENGGNPRVFVAPFSKSGYDTPCRKQNVTAILKIACYLICQNFILPQELFYIQSFTNPLVRRCHKITTPRFSPRKPSVSKFASLRSIPDTILRIKRSLYFQQYATTNFQQKKNQTAAGHIMRSRRRGQER